MIADASGKQRGVLVVGRHDVADPFELLKVIGQCQRDARPAARERRVGDAVLVHFRDEGDPRVFDAPDFFGEILRVRKHRRLRVDVPVVDAVRGTGRAQVRPPGAVFDAAQQQG
jgi:hypothetical protein